MVDPPPDGVDRRGEGETVAGWRCEATSAPDSHAATAHSRPTLPIFGRAKLIEWGSTTPVLPRSPVVYGVW